MKKQLLVLVLLAAIAAPAAAVDDDLFNSLSYRLVGPYRGGRVTAVTGVPGDPMTYYMGSTGGRSTRRWPRSVSFESRSAVYRRPASSGGNAAATHSAALRSAPLPWRHPTQT
jgi:hypothetical protein